MPEAPDPKTAGASAPKPLKSTLNLPQTAFPMKANLPVNEPLRLAAWEESNLYAQIRAASAGRPRYILHDGPPYANGAIQIGRPIFPSTSRSAWPPGRNPTSTPKSAPPPPAAPATSSTTARLTPMAPFRSEGQSSRQRAAPPGRLGGIQPLRPNPRRLRRPPPLHPPRRPALRQWRHSDRKANLPVNEPLRLAAWEESNLYAQIRAASAGRPRYILHDGPPYANGAIQIGRPISPSTSRSAWPPGRNPTSTPKSAPPPPAAPATSSTTARLTPMAPFRSEGQSSRQRAAPPGRLGGIQPLRPNPRRLRRPPPLHPPRRPALRQWRH